MSDRDNDSHEILVATVVIPKVKEELRKPRMFKVIMLNDDYTDMDFVIALLKTYFNKSTKEAQDIMLEVHEKGRAIVGIYSLDIAQTRTRLAMKHARKEEYPLQIKIDS